MTKLPNCDPTLFKEGHTILITNTVDPADMEHWVKCVAKDSNCRVDWSFIGGRIAVVCMLEDFSKVRQSISKLGSLLDEYYLREVLQYELPVTNTHAPKYFPRDPVTQHKKPWYKFWS